MLRFVTTRRTAFGRISRREWLRAGALAGLAGSLGWKSNQASAEEAAAFARRPGFGRAKGVIVVFCNGGQSQIDTWDPKPNAPLDVRGAFAPISTAVPGVQVCEHLPRVAKVLDRLTLVRSMSHEDLDHGSAAYLALTGVYHARRSSNPPPSPLDIPTYGSVLSRVRPNPRFPATAVHLNAPALTPREPGPGQFGGVLGKAYDPLVVDDASSAAGAIPGLAPLDGLGPERFAQRLTLKQQLDAAERRLDAISRAHDLGEQFEQARRMLASAHTRAAFDLSQEPRSVRERYGLNRSGQALLLARRLIAAGVPYVNVIWNQCNRGQDISPDDTDLYGWDTHNDIFDALKQRLLPRFDQSFSALIEDLSESGLLDDTLVVCLGEFGRAPQVALEAKFAGSSPGRKHWANVYTVAFAGAGVSRGAILGASDRLGGEPITDRYGPWDLAATLFHSLGLNPSAHYHDTASRPFVISHGKPMVELFGG